MGVTLAGSSTSAEAPNIEKGMYDARFDGMRAETLEKSQFGNNDVFIWAFTLMEDGEVIYDEGEAVEVEAITSRSTNTKSQTKPRAVSYLEAIMTDEEFADFVAEKPIDADELIGRKVQVIISIKENGWPKVEDVLPAKKARRSKSAE